MKKYKIKLHLDGDVRFSYIELENNLTEDEVKETIKDYIDEIFEYRYEEILDEEY